MTRFWSHIFSTVLSILKGLKSDSWAHFSSMMQHPVSRPAHTSQVHLSSGQLLTGFGRRRLYDRTSFYISDISFLLFFVFLLFSAYCFCNVLNLEFRVLQISLSHCSIMVPFLFGVWNGRNLYHNVFSMTANSYHCLRISRLKGRIICVNTAACQNIQNISWNSKI
jgi:hypothetical protein